MGDLEDEYDEDPELHDENDPEYQQEMFRIYQSLGWRPEDLHDRAYAEQYAEWLKTATEE
jgi:hypothetical protein